MRERTTWNRDLIKQAASAKRADPYLMNQDHVNKQPPADKYVTGDPSTFAEDIHPSKDTWEVEYQNGQVKRNEIGMPEMRKDTFNHPEKTASKDVLLKKANLCIRLAQMMLNQGGKTASDQAIEDQSVALMHLPDNELVDTFNRLAGEEEESKEAEGQEQQKQAEQQMQSQQMQQAMDQCKAALAAGDQQGFQAALQQMVQAQMQQQAQPQQQAPMAQGQQTVEQIVQAAVKRAMEQVQAQPQQQAPQAQQQPQAPQAQQQAPAVQAQQPQAPQAQQQPQEPVADDALLDEMLMEPGDPGGMSEMDIELEAPNMDVGDVGLGPEDEVLKTLFANDDEGGGEQEQQGQGEQQKQAGMSRTASTRTVGTRPSGGVSKVGGGAPAGRGGAEADKLAGLWSSAPSVKDAFGM